MEIKNLELLAILDEIGRIKFELLVLKTGLKELNDKMAERFNKDGVFPKVLVLNKDTSVLGEIDGYRQTGMDDIIVRIKKMIK